MKRKNAASLRELTRELKECKRKLDQQNSGATSQVRIAAIVANFRAWPTLTSLNDLNLQILYPFQVSSLHPVSSRVSGMSGSPIDPSSRASSELSLNPASASDQDNNGSNGVNCNDVANNGSRSPRFSVDVSFKIDI